MSRAPTVNAPDRVGGSVSGRQDTAIRFPDAMPGLEDAQVWELAAIESAAPFFYLRSVDRPPLRLLVIDPRLVVESYAPDIPPSALARIDARSLDGCVMLATVTVRSPDEATINLRAPLLINPTEMLGAQVILDDPDWPLHHPIAGAGARTRGTGRSPSCSSSPENPVSR